MADSPRSVESSVRVYKVLIEAYPASFRREYGDEMALVFREHIADAWRQHGAVGLVTAWLRILGDLLRTAPQQHFSEMQGRTDMKNAAMAILSAGLATIIYLFVQAFLWLTIGFVPLLAIGHGAPTLELLILYLSAFLTGLVLARAKPFFMPRVTVPLGTMAMWGWWSLLVYFEDGPFGLPRGWLVLIGFTASVGLVSLLGCVVATKAASRLARFSLPWYQVIGPLAVLVCTSAVACVLQVTLTMNRLEADLQRIFGFCLFALLVIGVVTIANLVLVAVRSNRNAEARQ